MQRLGRRGARTMSYRFEHAFIRGCLFRAAASLVAGIVVSPPVLGADGGRSEPARPNVVYVFSDEHRWQSMSFTEMPQVKTPNMDRLAAQGFAFAHCISNYPVCTPHRAILMTGRWPF